MKTQEMPAYKIYLSDGTDYVTSMAKGITLSQAKGYFLGQWLNVGQVEDRMVYVQKVEVA